jgi:hypothetical protein
MEWKSVACTQANDTDDDHVEVILSDDEEPTSLQAKSVGSTQANDTDDDDIEVVLSDDEEPTTPFQAPLGVSQVQPQRFIPVCVAFIPVVQQPVVKKSSRSARRRRLRAMNRWFRGNMQNAAEGEQQDGAFDDDLDAEFGDEWQLPGSDAETPEMDSAESWPTRNSPPEASHDQKKKADILQ